MRQQSYSEETFSDRVRAVRTEAGYSQAALASALHVSNATVAKWELVGDNPAIKASTMAALCRLLGVRADYLLGMEGAQETPPISAEEQELLGVFRSLRRKKRAVAIATIRAMI